MDAGVQVEQLGPHDDQPHEHEPAGRGAEDDERAEVDGQRQGVPPAAVAIAWLASRDDVVGALASARTTIQLEGLLAAARVELTADDLASLDAASTPLG